MGATDGNVNRYQYLLEELGKVNLDPLFFYYNFLLFSFKAQQHPGKERTIAAASCNE